MTTKDYPEPTRRSVLTSVGAAGVGGYGFLRFRGASTAGDGGEYTNYTLANTHGPQLLVGWYSTYNGHLRSGAPTDGDAWKYDATEEYVDGVDAVLADHPAVDIGNLLPGDSGTLSVGLFITPDSDPGRVWMRLDSGAGSQLSEAIELEVWYDTGIFGIGGCQGAENGPTIDTITPPGATLADSGSLSEGIEINSGIFDNGVIEPGERVCVALSWEFPAGNGNELQDSSTTFDLEFCAVDAAHEGNTYPCEGGE